MKRQIKVKKLLSGSLRSILIALLVIIEAYPIFWLLTAALKRNSEFTTKPAYSLPEGFYLDNFSNAWTEGHMGTYFKNSLICTLISLIFIVIFSMSISFAITKMNWKHKGLIASYFKLGIMIPVPVCLIPLFQIYKSMGLINTRASLIISYVAFGLSLSILLISGYLKSLSNEIFEAAVIDGCDIFKLMTTIVVPLMKNGIVTVLVLQFFFKWNDLIFSNTFISQTDLKTIQTGLLYFETEFGSKDWGSIFASISMSVLPMLFLYLALNKTIIEGMSAGAVKG